MAQSFLEAAQSCNYHAMVKTIWLHSNIDGLLWGKCLVASIIGIDFDFDQKVQLSCFLLVPSYQHHVCLYEVGLYLTPPGGPSQSQPIPFIRPLLAPHQRWCFSLGGMYKLTSCPLGESGQSQRGKWKTTGKHLKSALKAPRKHLVYTWEITLSSIFHF